MMTAKPGCHSDSLWKERERERKRGRRESWQVYRCIVSATQWCREKRIATPAQERLEGELILTNCMSFCLYCFTFFFLPLPLFSLSSTTSICSSQTSPFCFPLLSPSPILRLSLSAPWHSLFSPACSLFFLPVATSLAGVSCAVSCTVATNQALHSSRVICVTESWKCALSPLLCLHWQPPLHFIITAQIRSELGQVTQCWINGEGGREWGFTGLVAQAEMMWGSALWWSYGLFAIDP